jgi:hypothetical protein
MKIIINEKQQKFIDTYKDLNEEGEPTTGADTPPTSTGYPEVGKWESGATRGPSNQIGNTKWSEVVGSTIKRDKGNKLT